MDFKYGYKYILNLLIGLIFVCINLIYYPANAKDLTYLSQLNPPNSYSSSKLNFGMDISYLLVGHNGDYNKIFRKNRAGGNFYVGYHLNGVMLEVGYSFTTRRAKSTTITGTIANPGTFLGQPITEDTQFIGKVRFKNTHLTLNLLTDLSQDLKIVTALGIGFVRPHTIFKHINSGTGAVSGYNGVIASKTTLVPRLGLGFSLISSPTVSWRVMGYFEKFSKIIYKTAPSVGNYKPFKNGCSCLIGMMVKL